MRSEQATDEHELPLDSRVIPGLAERVLELYQAGLFPMADPDEPGTPLGWYRPERRGVITLVDSVYPDAKPASWRIPSRLRSTLRSHPFRLTCDVAFGSVIRACSLPRHESENNSEETWIDDQIIGIFEALHAAGHAHSVEAWLGEQLVGGVYGLAVGRVFAAESMFTRRDLGGSDSSKIALVALASHLRRCGFVVIDTQFTNPNVNRFGAHEQDGTAHQTLLESVGRAQLPWGSFEAEAAVLAETSMDRAGDRPHSGQSESS